MRKTRWPTFPIHKRGGGLDIGSYRDEGKRDDEIASGNPARLRKKNEAQGTSRGKQNELSGIRGSQSFSGSSLPIRMQECISAKGEGASRGGGGDPMACHHLG